MFYFYHLYPLQCAVEDYELIGPLQYNGKDNRSVTHDQVHIFPLINVHHFSAHVKEEDWRTYFTSYSHTQTLIYLMILQIWVLHSIDGQFLKCYTHFIFILCAQCAHYKLWHHHIKLPWVNLVDPRLGQEQNLHYVVTRLKMSQQPSGDFLLY